MRKTKGRRLKVGAVEWSLEIERAITRHRYWVLVLLRMDGHNISARRLVRLAKEMGQDNPGMMAREAKRRNTIK